MVNYGKPVLLNCTVFPKKIRVILFSPYQLLWIISLVPSQAMRLMSTAHRLGKIAEHSTKPLRINE